MKSSAQGAASIIPKLFKDADSCLFKYTPTYHWFLPAETLRNDCNHLFGDFFGEDGTNAFIPLAFISRQYSIHVSFLFFLTIIRGR
jgi:hypothetical protein